MSKELEIEYIHEGDTVYLRVVKQTHIQSNFGENGRDFQSSTGFWLASECCPEARPLDERLLYVRGNEEDMDEEIVRLYHPSQVFDINQAVFEYNDYFRANAGKGER